MYANDLLYFWNRYGCYRKKIKELLTNNFVMKDLGEVNVFLSMKITRILEGYARSIRGHRKNT